MYGSGIRSLDLELGTIPHDDGADNFIEEETLWICKFISKSLRLDNLFLRVIVWDYDLEDVASGSWEAGYLSAVRSIPVSIDFAAILLIQTEKYDDDYSTQQAYLADLEKQYLPNIENFMIPDTLRDQETPDIQ
jgi:hypothetical protein